MDAGAKLTVKLLSWPMQYYGCWRWSSADIVNFPFKKLWFWDAFKATQLQWLFTVFTKATWREVLEVKEGCSLADTEDF